MIIINQYSKINIKNFKIVLTNLETYDIFESIKQKNKKIASKERLAGMKY